MNATLDLLRTRRSVPPLRLAGPGPDAAELDALFAELETTRDPARIAVASGRRSPEKGAGLRVDAIKSTGMVLVFGADEVVLASYPATIGTLALREAAAEALSRRYGTVALPEDAILPVIGTKEAIAQLPSTLGLGAGDTVVIPEVAYPTYEVGARYARCEPVAADSTIAFGFIAMIASSATESIPPVPAVGS